MQPGFPSRLWRLCQKELKETLRDRRTIITLVLMPLLVYPLLSMGLNRFLLNSGVSTETTKYTIGVSTPAEQEELTSWLEDPASQPPQAIVDASNGGVAEFVVVCTEPETAEQTLLQNKIDVAAEITGTYPREVTFIAYSGDNTSQMCQRILAERVQWLRTAIAETMILSERRNFRPFADVKVRDVGESSTASALATIVPLVLVLMTITGAVYPAIDLTAGERERGTMEALMASPVPRFYVLLAKYAAVVTVALLTAVANLVAMFTTLWASRLLPLLTGNEDGAFPWIAIFQILGLLVLFSGFFSAVLLSLTSFAKSFKEAQAYLIPIMLLSLAPGMLSMMPGVTFTGPMAIAPMINIVLLARDVLSGTVVPATALAAVLSTVAYATAALAVAAKLFGSDAVTRSSDQTFTALFKRPSLATGVPSPQTCALMLALLVPVHFVISNGLMMLLQNKAESINISQNFLLNAVALTFTFGGIPLAAALFGRHRLQTTYRVRMPSPFALLGAVLVGFGAWALAFESIVFADALGIGGLDESRLKQMLGALDKFTKASPWLLVACLALTPAIIEELCFRGFLFSSLRRIMSPWQVIALTSVLFGLFHVLTGNALLIERFLPTTLLGIVLGWIAFRTGSVIPGMVMHFIHNAFIELFGHYHKELEQIEWLGVDVSTGDKHLPTTWVVTATAIAVVGLLVIGATSKRGNADDS